MPSFFTDPIFSAIFVVLCFVLTLSCCLWLRCDSMGAGPGSVDWVSPVRALLRHRGLNLSRNCVARILSDMDKHAPWFAVSGDLTLPCWDKLGKDLEAAKAEGKLGKGTYPMWRLIRQCLKDDSTEHIFDQGRKMLYDHQDSLSEMDTEKGSHKEQKEKSKKEKTSKIKEKKVCKQKLKEKGGQKEKVKYPIKNTPPRLYPSLEEEFSAMELQESDSLDEEEESELEEEAERYEEERYGPLLHILPLHC